MTKIKNEQVSSFQMNDYNRGLVVTLFAALLIYLFLAFLYGYNLFEHSPYDSYTLQALAWRSGRLSLDRNYDWLELAVYNGQYYVSFPPFPTVIMLFLSLFFGGDTPSMAVNLCFFLGSTAFAYLTVKRFGRKPFETAFIALFLTTGCNLLELSMLPLILGPFCIAAAVGCRPFQAVYVPYVLFRLYQQCQKRFFAKEKQVSFPEVLRRMIPYLILPALVAAAYAILNFARFGNIFEFGHNYLPEFSTEGGVQFSAGHWLNNVKNIFRLPYFQNNQLIFPKAYGFAFYLCNPLFLIGLIETFRRFIRKSLDRVDIILLISMFLHINLLLLHRTFGGVQFGTRYLVDALPMLAFYTFSRKEKLTLVDWLLMVWGIAFNFYGSLIYFYFI